MKGRVCAKYQHTDPLNRCHSRNVRNASKYNYNCAGYALECFSWYCPDKLCDRQAYGFITNEEAQRKTDLAVAVMLHDFPTLRVISNVEEAQRDEYVIAFRLSSDGDFHYVKRDSHNHWRHKMGASLEIRTMRAADVLSGPWSAGWISYDGPIVLFAKKLKKGLDKQYRMCYDRFIK